MYVTVRFPSYRVNPLAGRASLGNNCREPDELEKTVKVEETISKAKTTVIAAKIVLEFFNFFTCVGLYFVVTSVRLIFFRYKVSPNCF